MTQVYVQNFSSIASREVGHFLTFVFPPDQETTTRWQDGEVNIRDFKILLYNLGQGTHIVQGNKKKLFLTQKIFWHYYLYMLETARHLSTCVCVLVCVWEGDIQSKPNNNGSITCGYFIAIEGLYRHAYQKLNNNRINFHCMDFIF